MRTSATDRRSFVQRIVGWCLAAAAAPQVVFAQQAARTGQEPARLTFPQALTSNDRDVVAGFVKRNGRVATGAPLEERVEAMKLLAHGPARRASPGSGMGKRQETCAACQAAAAILLRRSVNNPREFRAFVDGVGGRAWVEQAMRTFENAELRSALEKGLAGIKAS
jgi:hypothetical protein